MPTTAKQPPPVAPWIAKAAISEKETQPDSKEDGEADATETEQSQAVNSRAASGEGRGTLSGMGQAQIAGSQAPREYAKEELEIIAVECRPIGSGITQE